MDEIDDAFADIHSAAVSIGTFWARASVPLLSAAFGALCTLVALAYLALVARVAGSSATVVGDLSGAQASVWA